MKKTLTALTTLSLATSALLANDMESRIKAIEAKMQALEEENARLKSVARVVDKLESLEEKIDSVETMKLKDKIDWGLGFKTRVDNYEGKLGDGTKYTDKNVWSSKLMLNMSSDIADNMKFNGRLSMYKYWGDSIAGENGTNPYLGVDYTQGRSPGDSGVFAERAYVDWLTNKGSTLPFTVTIGRQPSSDGPSHHYKEKTARKSTYSALGFDGAADGVVGTFNFSKLTGIEDHAIRVAYGKSFQNRAQRNDGSYLGKTQTLKDTDVMGVFHDMQIPGLPGSLVQIGYVKAKDIIAMPTDITSNTSLGNMSLWGAAVEVPRFMGTGMNFFVQAARSKTISNGQYYTDATYTNSQPLGLLVNGGQTGSKSGSAFWAGVRYDLPFKNEPSIGIEYNRGTKNWVSFTPAPNDLSNKLATRGSAVEVYYTHPLNQYASLRAGALFIDYKYTGSGNYMGAPMSIEDARVASSVDKVTNYYLQFNLLY